MDDAAVSPDEYIEIRSRVFEAGYDDEWEWAQSVQPPETAIEFAGEAIWVVCCSGFREQAARVTKAKVMAAIAAGRSAIEVFPKSGKGRAIDVLWANRLEHFANLRKLIDVNSPPEIIIGFVATLPYVGGRILRYHFAKNIGIDCAKPDRWLCRLAGVPEDGPAETNFKASMDYCRPLAIATGDRIAAVDVVLWRACNIGILAP